MIHRSAEAPPVLAWVESSHETTAASPAMLRDRAGSDVVATCVMPLGSYNLLQIEAPKVPPEELRSAVRWRVKDLIDFPIDLLYLFL